VKSKTINRFWRCYAQLPKVIQKQAKEVYRLFMVNPFHPRLHFKKIHSSRPIFSVRITKDYRAVGILQDNEIIWYWIGSHSDYDQLIKQLRKA
jgi:hypothetical protein